MAEGSPFTKAGLLYIREHPNDSLDNCFLLSLNSSSNNEQKLAILAYFSDNYRRLPAERILVVPLTI